MEKIVEIGKLLDIYGKVLSKKQFDLLEMHYINDLSLTEISENESITRQGVHDNVKRGYQHLLDLDSKLNLIAINNDIDNRFLRIQQLSNIIKDLSDIDDIKKANQDILDIINDYLNKEE